ncbi:zinc finger protein 99-like isoform X2 [Pectinophora gossypiella]|uniref:zinc finger protein 99-like isoform X2 n=1 Tax=Pectinophora gossypiella TaxID=13191 RepID=UPI00214EBC69|nr:zinc finger protein 99-like isoform X2 [Pectinophora gossypiella]
MNQFFQDSKLGLTRPPRLAIHTVHTLSCPDIKTEFDSLHIDGDTYDDSSHNYDVEANGDVEDFKEEEYLEPDTFVNDFDVINKKEDEVYNKVKPIRIKDKKKKEKVKKNIKVKRKKIKAEDKLNTDESCLQRKSQELKNKREDKSQCVSQDKNETEDRPVKAPVILAAAQPRKPREPRRPGEKPECIECGKVFSSRKTLRYHLNVIHNGNNSHPCPRCDKVFQWKSNLWRHLRSHKARETGELYCETCDKRFASLATYKQHLAVSKQHVSEGEYSFSCSDCGKKFVNKTRLRDHIDWEHLQKIKFRCQLCNKPFKCHTSLYVHMKNVHKNKGLKDNLCHVCGKSYQNLAKLRYHIVAMHTTETPYQCEQCSAAFGWYSSLYRHVREVHYKIKIHKRNKTKKLKKPAELPGALPPLLPPHLMTVPQAGLP